MRKIYSIGTTLFLIFILSSCAQKMTFSSSPVVPAATGKVKVKKDNNDNYIITVNVIDLVKPDKLTPPKDVYVVWMESDRNAAKNIGRINTSSGLFSKKLKGELKATATSRPTRIFITAEEDGNVRYPSVQMVLRTD